MAGSYDSAWQPWVDNLRAYLRDTVAKNRLEQVQENTDDELYDALFAALTQINGEFIPLTSWTVADISTDGTTYLIWSTLRLGAVLEILTSVGILSARNTLTYRDNGGVTVQDYDKYGRYMAFYNMLLNKYMKAVTAAKIAYNINQGYGGQGSEWYNVGYGSRESIW